MLSAVGGPGVTASAALRTLCCAFVVRKWMDKGGRMAESGGRREEDGGRREGGGKRAEGGGPREEGGGRRYRVH